MANRIQVSSCAHVPHVTRLPNCQCLEIGKPKASKALAIALDGNQCASVRCYVRFQLSLRAKHTQGGGDEMQNQPSPVSACCLVTLLALSVVIGSSCRPRQQQQTTLRIWQTAV